MSAVDRDVMERSESRPDTAATAGLPSVGREGLMKGEGGGIPTDLVPQNLKSTHRILLPLHFASCIIKEEITTRSVPGHD